MENCVCGMNTIISLFSYSVPDLLFPSHIDRFSFVVLKRLRLLNGEEWH